MARSEPEPTGLFLRYCAACNSTQAVAERGRCSNCGGEYPIVEAHALVRTLGKLAGAPERLAALAEVRALDKP